jgi:NADP-dependent 3-hydroxy acid dehydrogenase YdfG
MAEFKPVDRPTAIVTDAHTRLGETVARALAASGFHVVLTAAELDQCVELAAAIDGTALQVDVTSDDSVRSFATQVPHAAVLVIAGAGQPINTRIEADTHDWRWRWETRTLGTLRMVKALLPFLLDTDGLIVTISAEGDATPMRHSISDPSGYSERTLHRLVAAEIEGTSIRFTRIRAVLPDYIVDVRSFAANRTSLIMPPQMASRTAQDVAEVIAFVSTGSESTSLSLDEVVIRPWDAIAREKPRVRVVGR